jgi:hypothetical protein
MAITACVFFYYIKSERKLHTNVVWLAYSLLFAGIFLIFSKSEIYWLNHPRVWDYTAFYLYGKVAALGYNFYLPENFQIVFNSLIIEFKGSEYTDFMEAVVMVGFPYPTPTILYFLPLGFLSYNTALIVWTLFILLSLMGSIYLIYMQFLKEYGLNGLLLVSILFLIFPSVKFNLICSQTNFILLIYLLLMKKYAGHKFAGVFLALAFFTKPFMLIFGLYFLLSKNWKAIAYFIISAILFSGITLIIAGFDTFISYFLNNPTQRMPAWQFSEDVNQSLNAILLRANLISLDTPHVYLIISTVLLGLTVLFSAYLIKRKLDDYVWALLLLVGLIVYPGTLSYYGVILLFVMFQFFHTEKPLGLNLYLLIPVIGLFYYLNSVSVFASICFLLVIVVLKSLWQLKNDETPLNLNIANNI